MPKGVGLEKLSDAQKEKYGKAFEAIDKDGLGTINKEELTQIFPDELVDKAMSKISTDGDEVITKDEFLDFTYAATLEDARAIIQAADKSGDNKLSKEELAAAFQNFGFSADVVSELMESFDEGEDGKLDVDEVIDLLLEI